MGLSVSIVRAAHVGNRKEVVADVTFDSSYPTGGEALTAATLKLEHELDYVHPSVAIKPDGTKAVSVAYDHVNHKLQAFTSPGSPDGALPLVELTDTTSLDTYVARLRCVGVGSAA